MQNISSYKLASVIARFLDDKQGKDITILNISKVSMLADYFVIVTGTSSTQVKALTANLRERIKDVFERIPNNNENDLKNRWNLLDYGDVVVHILHSEERETYALEKFWSHAFKVAEQDWLEESKEFAIYDK